MLGLGLSDYTNAEALVSRHGDDMRYCYPWGKWLVWNGRHWEIDTTGQVMSWAKATIKAKAAEKLSDTDDEKFKEWWQHIKTSLNTGRLTAMVQQAQCERAVKPEAFDTHPWLLNCANGTLDLRTGTLGPHRREDLLTMGLTVAYDQDALCPKWDAFLHKIMQGSPTMIPFLRRVVGYATTGSTQEQKLFVLHGVGANGKSTFLNTLLTLLGPYGMKATSDLLMMSKSDRHPTERTDLCGKRLVAAIETEHGRRLSEVFVKEATGGDRIRARRMREDNWEFSPTHTILLGTNHKPEIRGTDLAMWRRVTLIPFTVTIPEDEQDTSLMGQLAAEFPGILAWVVQGCLAWQKGGLQVPQEVKDATTDYREEMDILQAFLEERCEVDLTHTKPHIRYKATPLYEGYKKWCEATGQREAAVNQRRFGESLRERGFEHYTNNGAWWRYVALLPPDDDNGIFTEPSEKEGSVVQPIKKQKDIGKVSHVTEPTDPHIGINSSKFPREAHNPKNGSVGSEGSVEELPSLVRHAQPARGNTCPDPRCRGTVEDKYGAVRCGKCQKTKAELRALFPHAWGG